MKDNNCLFSKFISEIDGSNYIIHCDIHDINIMIREEIKTIILKEEMLNQYQEICKNLRNE